MALTDATERAMRIRHYFDITAAEIDAVLHDP